MCCITTDPQSKMIYWSCIKPSQSMSWNKPFIFFSFSLFYVYGIYCVHTCLCAVIHACRYMHMWRPRFVSSTILCHSSTCVASASLWRTSTGLDRPHRILVRPNGGEASILLRCGAKISILQRHFKALRTFRFKINKYSKIKCHPVKPNSTYKKRSRTALEESSSVVLFLSIN